MNIVAAETLESDLMQSLLDGFPDPAFLLDRDHRVRLVNRSWRRIHPRGEEVLGRSCHEVLHHAPAACTEGQVDCPVRECALQGHSVHALHVHDGIAGEEHHHVSVHPLRLQGGEMVGFLQTFQPLRAASAVAHPRRLVGRSRTFLALLERLRRAAEHELPVLLHGEAGTGKRLAAETIHALGPRRNGPFVVVDASGLAGIPGHAPTSARPAWDGRFEAARGGTLLVREIGVLPGSMQADLLSRLAGSPRSGTAHDESGGAEFRLLATSSRDPLALARVGDVLPELLTLLTVDTIRVPPLRERMEDLPLLVDSLLERIGEHRSRDLEPSARALLANLDYPGNVSELLALLERASLLAEDAPIGAGHLERARHRPEERATYFNPGGEILSLSEVEERYLAWAVRNFQGSRSELAKHLGVAERTLFRKLSHLRQPASAPRGSAPQGDPRREPPPS